MKLGSACTPGVGLHAHGPFGFAVFDALLTVLASLLVSMLLGLGVMGFFLTTLALLAAGILVHRVMGVNTALNVKIFGSV